MCGVFGLVLRRDAGYSPAFVRKAVNVLGRVSEWRGKDSSGLVFRDAAAHALRVIKGAVPIRYLLAHPSVARELRRLTGNDPAAGDVMCVMGHSRLVTNGSQLTHDNNQPIIKDGIVGIHNGIVVNEAELWASNPDLQRAYEIDTEALLAVVRKRMCNGDGMAAAISRTAAEVVGTFSISVLANDRDVLALATNNGSLYVLESDGLFAFASEAYFLSTLARRLRIRTDRLRIRQIGADCGVVVDLPPFKVRDFGFHDEAANLGTERPAHAAWRVHVESVDGGQPARELILDPVKIAVNSRASTESALLEHNLDRIRALRRCTRCLLPETFPYINYDAAGVCNYCRNYRPKNQPKPLEELLEVVKPYRSQNGGQDCIIPYSGGRDSTHTLHIAKTVLGLNPVAFTYDWGMVNDLARRNIARVCGKLKVENVIVAADIWWKRGNIRKNILAWLRRPDLGMVPLFMAGDKYFFYYTDQIKRRTGIRLNIWGVNPLENTDFKVGFLGVAPDHRKKRIYSLSVGRQAKLVASIASRVAANPGYVNGSVLDTIGSFISRSIAPHSDYYHLYDYYRWDEQEIEHLVRDEYRWETAIDTRTTWRVGDGTAAFYNYVYYTVAGFSEYDTFRSNQIREGAMTREEGLRLVEEENRPRYASIRWYTDIVGIDFEDAIRCINAIPKRYA